MWIASITTTLKCVVNPQVLIKYCHNTGAFVQYFSMLSLFLQHHRKHSNVNAPVPQHAFQV
jgi:hypothetical protein